MSLSLPEPYVGLDTFNERSVKEHADQVQRNFEALGRAWSSRESVKTQGDGYHGHLLRVGSTTATITDGVSAATSAVNHNMGTTYGSTAVFAAVTAVTTTDGRDDYVATIAHTSTVNSTTFRVRGAAAESYAIANPTTVTVHYIIIGVR